MPIRTVLASALLALSVCANVAAEDKPGAFSDEQLTFFETKIRPVLADSCYSCHSHEAKRLKGGFYLDSRKAILDAFLVEPGEVEDSMLIEAVRYENPDHAMPPKGKLPDNQIKDLEKWVEMGMPWPEESGPEGVEVFDLEARKASHWAWKQPQLAKTLPKAPGLGGNANVIDRFVEARLAKEGIEPGLRADRATLIRRVTLDLTGLPPSPAEVQAFVNDGSPDAYERLVDRLLASPRFGEKWARHWLDLVRYAESFGHEFDINIPYAWKYRDYVIRAMQDDVPYDRFVKEHVAGDLIEPRIHGETKVNEAVKATGWWFMHEQTHAPTDVRTHEADRIDNQIDALSKTFMGVTVACARCHDHKFDAISDEDYYSLAGYLQSSRLQQAYLDPGGKIEVAMQIARSVYAKGQAAFDKLGAPPVEPTMIDHAETRLFESFNAGSFNGWRTTGWAWGDRPTDQGQWDGLSGKAAPVMPGVAHSGMLGDQAVGTLRSPEYDFQDRKVFLRVKGKGHVRIIVDSYTVHLLKALLFEGLESKVDTNGEWQWIVLSPQRDFYHGNGNHRAHLEIIDDDPNAHLIIDEVRFGDTDAPPNPSTPKVFDSIAPGQDPAFAALSKQLRAAAAKTPKPERALAITDGGPEDSYLHIRGGWRAVGEDLPRRYLTALGGEETPPSKTGSGREQLAEAMVAQTNPLAARVQVNRLWHHLFGSGIVPTVDNFGVLGLPASHPELLDHLAVTFMEDDAWSNKAMIKRIVMSRAYQRTSDRGSSEVEMQDPQNVLLHRQNIRRMTSETLRDSILAVAGSLNEQKYGPPVPVHLTQFMQGRGRPKGGPIDGKGRRSIYISVRRNFLSPMMLTFDTPIPFSTVGRRNRSNVPAQSLTLMNDPFVHNQAKRWAGRLIKDGQTDVAERIAGMFVSAIGREPTDEEHKAALSFVNQLADDHRLDHQEMLVDHHTWAQLCHAMFNVKGFTYVR
ncbi:MAG: PSD1 and planctomycete cytochrome C domain-containing protein [Phycisphaeraceae bacterium]|nr:PSD1 and planctomycete cytochrome C domain-containing protein [Phycisphaeraceae bacterium]